MAATTPANSSAARVVVFGLGGTTAMTPATTGGAPPLSPHQLLDAVPGLVDTGVALDVVAFRSRPGASLTFDDLTRLATAIREHLTAGASRSPATARGTATTASQSSFHADSNSSTGRSLTG